MSPYNALSVPQQLKSKSCDQSDVVSTKVKNIDNLTLKLGLTTLIATVIYLPNLSQAAYSADLRFQNPTTQGQDGYSGLFPKIVDLLPTPLKKLANLSRVSPADPDQDLFLTAKAQVNKSYFDDGEASDEQELSVATDFEISILPHVSMPFGKPSLRIHSVKSGDTVYKIAQQYQVNPDELIQLNGIQNSDVILVNQELMIPHQISNPVKSNTKNHTLASLNLANQNLRKSPSEKKLASTNLSNRVLGQDLGIGGQRPAKKMAKLDEDPYIAGLRADIEKLRAEYRQQRQQQRTNAPIRSNVSRVDSDSSHQLSINTVSTIENHENDDVVTSIPERQNPKPDLFAEDKVALQLPPLSSPEEYLPSTFDGYTWPAKGVLTSGYGWRWGRLHGGIDIAAPIGTPVMAAASGTVISSGWNNGGYGNLIELEHLDGSKTLYAHNNRILVSTGQKVVKGEQIAEMGSTGYSTGSHLHFEIHPKSQGAVNPLALLN